MGHEPPALAIHPGNDSASRRVGACPRRHGASRCDSGMRSHVGLVTRGALQGLSVSDGKQFWVALVECRTLPSVHVRSLGAPVTGVDCVS